jgi:DNA-binding winged helix-turn-helix (wHTH) protein
MDDPLATLLDKLQDNHQRISTVENIIASGFLAFLLPRGPRSSENILYSIAETDSLLLCTPQGVRILKERPTAQILSLLQIFSLKSQTKEDIFKAIWGRRYFPERDDAGIYVLVRRLRRMLGENAALVVSKRGYYTLRADFRILHTSLSHHHSMQEPAESVPAEDSRPAVGHEQNTAHRTTQLTTQDIPHPRLLRLKEWIKDKTSFSAEDWEKESRISRASACRDLVFAAQKGWIHKRGEGRGVWYGPADEIGNSETIHLGIKRDDHHSEG